MLVIILVAWQAYARSNSPVADVDVIQSVDAMKIANALKHIAMLDVLCMGVFVVCWSAVPYRAMGFNLSLMQGMVPLVSAEIVHLIAYTLVTCRIGDHSHYTKAP